MHPILGRGSRPLVYLAGWLPIGGLLAILMAQQGVRWPLAFALALPLAEIFAFICLAAWYPSRANPLSGAGLWRVLANHLLAAVLSVVLWMLAALLWAVLLSKLAGWSDAVEVLGSQRTLLLGFGLLLYALAAGGCYLFLAFEASYEAERRALEAQRRQAVAGRELELARDIQKRLLPPSEHTEPGLRLAARNLAASTVAGDFYDYFRCPDGSFRVAVADVAGKGVAASLITATVKAILPLVAAERSVVETLSELNRRLAGQLDRREFVALALASWDPHRRRLELANAGLPDAYRLTADGRVEALEVPQPRFPLGLRQDLEYQSLEVELAEGDRVLLLTDGLPEASTRAAEPLGYEALETLLGEQLQSGVTTPGGWLDGLLEAVRRATESEPDDDWTALLLEPQRAENTS